MKAAQKAQKNHKVLSAEERQRLVPPLQTAVKFEYDGGGFCHFPIHGIREFAGEKILFQTSLCWFCGNLSLTYPDSSGFVMILGPELKEVCHELMPIPEKEMVRFNLRGFGSSRYMTKS